MSRPTIVLPISAEGIAQAVDAIRAGRLVAFPTETVYGLGAKGRPATNPVIVHVASAADATRLGKFHHSRSYFQILADRFWPGPLSLVVPRGSNVPDIVTAGGPTVAIRVPAHPVAQALLRASGVPIAAPSANRSTCLSPTRPEHVLRGLDGRIDCLLDGGACSGGLESTVLDITTDPPTLLRPGLIAIRELENAIGSVRRQQQAADSVARSPGQMQRHYSPRTPLEFAIDDAERRVASICADGSRTGWLTFGDAPAIDGVTMEFMPAEPRAYAAKLYSALHRLDLAGVERIVISLPPENDEWLAIHDRLGRMGKPFLSVPQH